MRQSLSQDSRRCTCTCNITFITSIQPSNHPRRQSHITGARLGSDRVLWQASLCFPPNHCPRKSHSVAGWPRRVVSVSSHHQYPYARPCPDPAALTQHFATEEAQSGIAGTPTPPCQPRLGLHRHERVGSAPILPVPAPQDNSADPEMALPALTWSLTLRQHLARKWHQSLADSLLLSAPHPQINRLAGLQGRLELVLRLLPSNSPQISIQNKSSANRPSEAESKSGGKRNKGERLPDNQSSRGLPTATQIFSSPVPLPTAQTMKRTSAWCSNRSRLAPIASAIKLLLVPPRLSACLADEEPLCPLAPLFLPRLHDQESTLSRRAGLWQSLRSPRQKAYCAEG